MNILVAVASKHGSTHEIADTIAEELRIAGHTVDLQQAGDIEDIARYDAVILGSAIYAGNWLAQAKQFANRHRIELTKVPVWVFSSGPLGTLDPQPHDDPNKLTAPLGGIEVRDHRVFVGKLDKSTLGLAERMIAKVVKAPEGDFRDWDAIRAWAHDITAALAPATAHSP